MQRGLEELAQWVKCLLYKYEDPSLDPSSHVRKARFGGMLSVIPVHGGRDSRVVAACWPANVDKQVTSRFSGRSFFQKIWWEE